MLLGNQKKKPCQVFVELNDNNRIMPLKYTHQNKLELTAGCQSLTAPSGSFACIYNVITPSRCTYIYIYMWVLKTSLGSSSLEKTFLGSSHYPILYYTILRCRTRCLNSVKLCTTSLYIIQEFFNWKLNVLRRKTQVYNSIVWVIGWNAVYWLKVIV
jgi:hypothetical protein